MEPFTLFSLFCLVAGALIVWIIRKLIFERDHVTTHELEIWKQKFQETNTANAVNESLLAAAKEDLQKATNALGSRSKEVERLIGDISDKTAECSSLELDKNDLRVEINKLKLDLQAKVDELQKSTGTVTGLQEKLKYTEEKLETQKTELENIGQKFEANFKVMASSILDDKSQKFTEQQEANLKNILQPLKENIHTFKQEFENRFNRESEERISLNAQVKMMLDLNKTLSQQANNLTEALRGNVKQQGNWGEMILESILEYSGLQKNMQYFIQERNYNDDGKGIQPDVIVKYPNNRSIIIDSKVSLLHYERYCAPCEMEEQKLHLQQIVSSFKSHIDGLASKGYHTIKDAMENIIMFVPVEGAYITAMNADPQLWQYAYGKGILLISPSNLILALKLVKDMWQKDGIDKNAQTIAILAGKIYDKLAGFVDSYESMGKSLQQAVKHYDNGWNQMKDGKGNMISQAEQMKKLHIKAKKNLPTKMVEEALISDGFEPEEEEETVISLPVE